MPGTVVSSGTYGVGAEDAQRGLAGVDLGVEDLDQPQRGGHVPGPRLGQLEVGQLAATGRAEQIRHRTRMTEGHQRGVNPVLQRRAVPHQVQPPAGPLPLAAHRRIGQPDRRHQIPPRQLGQHPGVDLVGLAGQRRESLDLDRVGDLHRPAAQL
jgi:hypothetical protein